MKLLVVWLMGAVVMASAYERGPDGFIRENGGCGTRPGGKICSMESVGYPGSAPRNLRQTWSFLSAADYMLTALRVQCSDVSTPEGEPCGDYVFKFSQGREEKKWCGNVGTLSFLTTKDYVRFAFNTGPLGGGKLKCSVWAVQVDAAGNEVPTSPKPPTRATTPAPTTSSRYRGTLPHFLLAGSAERDSTEHGVGRGVKQTTCKCGWTNKAVGRIVLGDYAREHEFPWMAAIVEKGSRFNFCGASIISAWHVLTAAHCTEDAVEDSVPLAVIIGGHNMNRPADGVTQTIDVEKIVQHEKYTPEIDGRNVWRNDISLLVLKDEITFTSQIGPVCLPTSPMADKLSANRDYVKIIGWGAIYSDGPSSSVLKKVDVRAVPPGECAFMYRDIDPANPTQICTYAKSRASCQGDSGGPVVWADPETNRYTLVGLVSFGRVCADASPSVHTDIGYHMPWIQASIAKNKKSSTCSKA